MDEKRILRWPSIDMLVIIISLIVILTGDLDRLLTRGGSIIWYATHRPTAHPHAGPATYRQIR